MKLDLLYKIVLSFFIFLILSLLLPLLHFDKVDAILGAATFLFGIFYGFEISVVLGNFAQLKTYVATQNAGLYSVFHLAQILGGEFEKNVTNNIEKYLLSAIDIPLEEHHLNPKLAKEFEAIFEPLRTLSPKADTDVQGQALQYINEGLYYIPQSRYGIAQVAPRFVNLSEWVLLGILGFVLVASLFLSRDGSVLSAIATAIFSTTVVSSLFLLEEIDTNRIEEANLEYNVFNSTLRAMGKIPYYPEYAIKDGIIKLKKGETYRVGIFPKYPSLSERIIEERKG